jgi:integrase
MVAEWERQTNVVTLTQSDAERIAAGWIAWAASEGSIVGDGRSSDIFEPLDLPEARTPAGLSAMLGVIQKHADEALRLAGNSITPDSRDFLLQAMTRPVQAAYLEADLKAVGIGGQSPHVRTMDQAASRLPSVAARAPKAGQEVTLRAMFEAYQRVATVKANVLKETSYAVEALIAFAGTDDVKALNRAALVRWRDKMKTDGLSNSTWNNRLSLLRQIFQRAKGDDPTLCDPTDGLRLRAAKSAPRYPYTDAEAARILLAARKETKATRRWAHWIMAFTGMRVGEVLQLDVADIKEEGGISYFEVEKDTPGKTVKSSVNRRVPIHRALIAEGLLEYAQSLPPGSPLFPAKRADSFGRRGGRGWKEVGEWVRTTVGITDKNKVPNHSWRHRVEDEFRVVGVQEELRDAVLGHARKTMGSRYGIRGEALQRLDEAVQRLPVPFGLA